MFLHEVDDVKITATICAIIRNLLCFTVTFFKYRFIYGKKTGHFWYIVKI